MVLSVVYVCRDGVMGDRCDVGSPMLTYPGVVDDGIFDTTTPPPSGRVCKTGR